MTQYIDKDDLLKEIEKLKCNLCPDFYEYNYDAAKVELLEKIKNYIDTLEVKEADLEKEYKDFVEEDPVYNKLVNGIVGKAIAKHFFELGMRTNNHITEAD